MSSLLLHSCCVHCAAYCIEHWRAKGYGVTVYWYNPNIHPYQEYLARLDSMRKLAEQAGAPMLVSEQYDAPRYFEAVQRIQPSPSPPTRERMQFAPFPSTGEGRGEGKKTEQQSIPQGCADNQDIQASVGAGFKPAQGGSQTRPYTSRPSRCAVCFDLRLSRTAKVAGLRGFSAFTTTLLISPQQQRDLVVAAGRRAQEPAGVPFLDEDLRKRYSDSRRITKKMDVYRQQYCGCMYSEWERWVGESE